MPSPTTSADWIIPDRSDVDLFRDLDCVIDLGAEVANRALDLGMTKQKLDCAQITSAAVDQHSLGPSQRVGAKLGWI